MEMILLAQSPQATQPARICTSITAHIAHNSSPDMSLLPSETVATPLVRILNQRTGRENAANDDICLDGVFDKYSVSTLLCTSQHSISFVIAPPQRRLILFLLDLLQPEQRMQDVTFAHFEQDPETHMLHFHLESHDRCDVKLKPRLWDQGAYFKSRLLTEGALRLIPHFLPITFRSGTAPKRQLSPSTASATSPRPQKRWVQGAESPEPRITFEMIEQVRAALQDQANESAQEVGFGQGHFEMLDEDKLAELDGFDIDQDRRASLPRPNQHYDHGTFTPRAHHRLPASVTHDTWTTDCEEASQRYINAHYNGVMPTTKSSLQSLRRITHQEMIRGKYGMDALKPCTRCVEDEVVCRVYHSDCYEWVFDGMSSQYRLGWSCVKCRGRNVSGHGGCDSYHVA
ncbi:hypothetical protein HBI56_161820 [Parastagonospora nodorum]|nr:hypothetical protein HBH53_160880 [Parastagonospora nodorum]KAH3960791.1 hypothetical protein HBH51_189180 [Parastagonospora nodorum]KAH3962769.1 hypothetical protein HBH52_221840 [Parastagonospora nodorum]KAH3994386.1 hypothetical protein HBI10_186570 [Parastagonospora nodorum]KAH4014310.1 hypothetical protein HBI13_172440 [Parastagonospora nodorum]